MDAEDHLGALLFIAATAVILTVFVGAMAGLWQALMWWLTLIGVL